MKVNPDIVARFRLYEFNDPIWLTEVEPADVVQLFADRWWVQDIRSDQDEVNTRPHVMPEHWNRASREWVTLEDLAYRDPKEPSPVTPSVARILSPDDLASKQILPSGTPLSLVGIELQADDRWHTPRRRSTSDTITEAAQRTRERRASNG